MYSEPTWIYIYTRIYLLTLKSNNNVYLKFSITESSRSIKINLIPCSSQTCCSAIESIYLSKRSIWGLFTSVGKVVAMQHRWDIKYEINSGGTYWKHESNCSIGSSSPTDVPFKYVLEFELNLCCTCTVQGKHWHWLQIYSPIVWLRHHSTYEYHQKGLKGFSARQDSVHMFSLKKCVIKGDNLCVTGTYETMSRFHPLLWCQSHLTLMWQYLYTSDLDDNMAWYWSKPQYTLNKKLVKVGHMGIKGGSSLVNHLVD